jgi:hypothetical protein
MELCIGVEGALLDRAEIVGHRIAEVLADSSLSDESYQYCDFLYVTDHGRCFRMPDGNPDYDMLSAATPPATCGPVHWPAAQQRHFQKRLWSAEITDILVVADPELRFPDTGAIRLSSGWYLVQSSGGPIGIGSAVFLVENLAGAEPMISIWECGSPDERSA